MTFRSLLGLLGLAGLAFLGTSPADAGPRYSFHATPGELPKDVVPAHYTLRIDPDIAKDRFVGRVDVEIEVLRRVGTLTLNAANLDFHSALLRSNHGDETNLSVSVDPARETATLAPASGAIEAGRYRLRIDYTGPIGKHAQGLFRVPYKLSERDRLVEKTILATHFEPVHARKMFPGWDEPAFRASYEVSVVVDQALTAVSNMPVSRITPLPGGRKEVAFARSVPMPTYLVALFVGEMDALEDEIDGIPVRIYTVKGKAGQAHYAMGATKRIIRYFNDYFGERYLLPKLDQIALPGGLGGAMENWGAVVYTEARLLLDPATTSLRLQQSIFGLIAHELAHQWFGDLVTMAWWDNLWLNEAFASWMATKTAEHFHPEWRARLRTAPWVDQAMVEDARKTTHPVQTPVDHDRRAMDLFDAITYNKGEAFIYMLERHLGEDAFRDGVRRYLRAHRLSNATTADLWHHLSETSGQDVKAFAAAWTEQPGYPVVRVAQRCNSGHAMVTVSQERFTLNDPQAAPLTWKVPVSLVGAGGERRALLLGVAPVQVNFGRCEPVRAANAGYYRVLYEDGGFGELVRNLERLDSLDRFRLLSDTFALVQAGRFDVTRYLDLVDRLGDETDRTVWDQAIESLRFLRQLIDAEDDRAAFDRYVVRTLAKPFGRAGWDARPGEDADAPALRRSLIEALGRAGDEAIVRDAQARFAARESGPIDPAIRPAVLNAVGRHADRATFDALLAMLRAATDVESKWQAQSALRHVANPTLQRRWMELLLTDELPPGEAVYNLNLVGTESDRPEHAWTFIRAHLAAVYAKASPRGRVHVLPEAASAFSDAARADELMELTRANLDETALYQAEKVADWIRLKTAVKAREVHRLTAWVRAR
ncbi:MAG: M1 family metallopeptidase [Betaproteobacteria bacterium]|nr:M1 family metallopeptidase [Betaproteobacteria bacterium]